MVPTIHPVEYFASVSPILCQLTAVGERRLNPFAVALVPVGEDGGIQGFRRRNCSRPMCHPSPHAHRQPRLSDKSPSIQSPPRATLEASHELPRVQQHQRHEDAKDDQDCDH